MACRFGWSVILAGALLAPRAADASWFAWWSRVFIR
jgi:hypothetical protein